MEKPKKLIYNPNHKDFNFTTKAGLHSNVKYKTVSDFKKMSDEPEITKLLVLGEIGTGKSSFSSKMIGIKFMHEAEFDEEELKGKTMYGDLVRVDNSNIKDHFKVHNSLKSVTKQCSFVLSRFLGDPNAPKIMMIDCPGFFDPEESLTDSQRQARGLGKRIADDMTEKLRALGSIDGVILLLPNNTGGRVTSNMINTLKGIQHMFKQQNADFTINLALCYTKCDEDPGSQRAYIHRKTKYTQEYAELIKYMQDFGIKIIKQTPPNLYFVTSCDNSETSIGQEAEFLKMIHFLRQRMPIRTADLLNPKAFIHGILSLLIRILLIFFLVTIH